jgi:hypothetical protein
MVLRFDRERRRRSAQLIVKPLAPVERPPGDASATQSSLLTLATSGSRVVITFDELGTHGKAEKMAGIQVLVRGAHAADD